MSVVIPLQSTLKPLGYRHYLVDFNWLHDYMRSDLYCLHFVPFEVIVDFACGHPEDVIGVDEQLEELILDSLQLTAPQHDHYRIVSESVFLMEQISSYYFDWLMRGRFPSETLLQQYWMDGRDITAMLTSPFV